MNNNFHEDGRGKMTFLLFFISAAIIYPPLWYFDSLININNFTFAFISSLPIAIGLILGPFIAKRKQKI